MGDVQGAIDAYQAGLMLNPNDSMAHNNLGAAYSDTKDHDSAIREFQIAIKLASDAPAPHMNMGNELRDMGKNKEAAKSYRTALKLDPTLTKIYRNLGIVLHRDGDLFGAIEAYKEYLKSFPEHAITHYNLAMALKANNQIKDAIKEYQAAVKYDSKMAAAHNDLAVALKSVGKIDEAIKSYEAALAIDFNNASTHFNLGLAYCSNGQLVNGVDEFQDAIRINPTFAKAYINLGLALIHLSRFEEALSAMQKAHDLGAKRADWPYPSKLWLGHAERLAHLRPDTAKILTGEVMPRNVQDSIALAWYCQHLYKQCNASAVQLYEKAFVAEPTLANNISNGLRYDAACAAALAGCGKGKDSPDQESARVRLRYQALDWLRADLKANRALLMSGPANRTRVAKTLEHWQEDPDFAGVRSDALAALPINERLEWRQLWLDIEVLRRAAEGKIAQPLGEFSK